MPRGACGRTTEERTVEIRELLELSYGEQADRVERNLIECGAFPVTLEEKRNIIGVCFVIPRAIRPPECNRPFEESSELPYETCRAALLSELCVAGSENKKREHARQLLGKTVRVCRELGFAAVFTRTRRQTEARELGFADVCWADTVRVRKVKITRYEACRVDDPAVSHEERIARRAAAIAMMHAYTAHSVAFCATKADFAHLLDSANLGDGMYLIRSENTYLALAAKDGNRLPFVIATDLQPRASDPAWLASRDAAVLAAAEYRGEKIFGGCEYERLSAEPADHVAVQAYICDKTTFERCMTREDPAFRADALKFLMI